MLDLVLWLIIAAFVVWEVVAHFILHNRKGHTLSWKIRHFENHYGLPAKILVAVAVGILGAHLAGAF